MGDGKNREIVLAPGEAWGWTMSMHILGRRERETHTHIQHARLTARERERERVGGRGVNTEWNSEYIHPCIECCATSGHTDLQDQGAPPVYRPLATHKRLLMPLRRVTINASEMETHCNATQASAAVASGVDRDKAAGWFQPNTAGLDRHLIIPQARACIFPPGPQISSPHTQFY